MNTPNHTRSTIRRLCRGPYVGHLLVALALLATYGAILTAAMAYG